MTHLCAVSSDSYLKLCRDDHCFEENNCLRNKDFLRAVKLHLLNGLHICQLAQAGCENPALQTGCENPALQTGCENPALHASMHSS